MQSLLLLSGKTFHSPAVMPVWVRLCNSSTLTVYYLIIATIHDTLISRSFPRSLDVLPSTRNGLRSFVGSRNLQGPLCWVESLLDHGSYPFWRIDRSTKDVFQALRVNPLPLIRRDKHPHQTANQGCECSMECSSESHRCWARLLCGFADSQALQISSHL